MGNSRAELRPPAADSAAGVVAAVPGSPPLAGSSNESGGGSASEVCGGDIDSDGRNSTQSQFGEASLPAAEALVENNSKEMQNPEHFRRCCGTDNTGRIDNNNADNTAPPRVPSSTSAAGGGGGGVGDSASA